MPRLRRRVARHPARRRAVPRLPPAGPARAGPRRLAPAAGPRSPWVLPEDGITDPVAVELAARGVRPVALTPGERAEVVAAVLAGGGTVSLAARRLRCSYGTARAIAAAGAAA